MNLFDTLFYNGCEAMLNLGNDHYLYVIITGNGLRPWEVKTLGLNLANRIGVIYAPIGYLHPYNCHN